MEKNNMISKIYDSIIDGIELTTKYLKELGISSKDINELIDENIIFRICRGKYNITDVNNLYNYGKELISLNEHEKKDRCFDVCYQMDPNHSGAVFQMFLKCIRNEDYDNILKYYD